MACKNEDRARPMTIAFRVTKEMNERLNLMVAMSGLTKQDYIMSKLCDTEITVIPSPRALKALRDEMRENPNFIGENKADLCASLQSTIIEILLNKLVRAARHYDIRDIAIAGGVSANSGLRRAIVEEGVRRGWNTFLPEFKFTTDNAAMIAVTGYFKYQRGEFAPMDVVPVARISRM